MQFQQDRTSKNKIMAFEGANLDKNFARSTGVKDAHLKWTSFLSRSSTSRTLLESSQLVELKYAISAA